MKKNIYLSIFFFFLVFHESSGQKLKKNILPNFTQINDTLFISKFEVSIREYSHYISYLIFIKKDLNFINDSLPLEKHVSWVYWDTFKDTFDVFTGPLLSIEDSTKSMNKKTSVWFYSYFGDFPIVNISLEQAKSYCNFKTLDYNQFISKQKKRKREKLPKSINYRLLTTSEWNLISNNSFDTSNVICSDYYLKKWKGNKFSPQPIYFGSENKYGIFNLFGNVSELIENGQVVGGSYNESLKECRLLENQKININDKFVENVGFRIVAVIK